MDTWRIPTVILLEALYELVVQFLVLLSMPIITACDIIRKLYGKNPSTL